MDRSACKAIVDREIEGLTRRLGLPHWRITVCYEPSETDDDGFVRAGECVRYVDYERARISLNPETFEDGDEDNVLAVLRHELFHVVIAPMDVFANAAETCFSDDARDAMKSIWIHAMEATVRNLERLWHGMTTVEPYSKVGE